MAAGYFNIVLSNGQTLSVWKIISQAVNSNPGCTFNGTAAATTTTTDFRVSSDCCISDITVDANCTAGGIEIYNVTDSLRSGKVIAPIGVNYLNSVKNKSIPRICFKANKTYRLIQIIAGNA